MESARPWALYVGGLLGPFGGAIVAAMLPELAATFEVSQAAVSVSITAYVAPFAVMLLASGTLGERWGRRRTVRAAYISYAVVSLACAAAPTFGIFLGARALQGMTNAFTTPLLLAGLAEAVPAARRGRAVGIFASAQAGGSALAPLVGGVAAEVDWRWAFVGLAAVAAGLAFFPPPGERRTAVAPPRWRSLLVRPVLMLALCSAAASAGTMGIPFLVAILAADDFGASAGERGLLLAGFGVAALMLGPVWGGLIDRVGGRRGAVVAAIGTAALVGPLGVVGSEVALAVLWAGAGATAGLLTVSVNSLAVDAVPTNRSGGVSVVQAFRFGGMAVAPLLWLPPYHHSPALAFALAGVCTLLAAVAVSGIGRGGQISGS